MCSPCGYGAHDVECAELRRDKQPSESGDYYAPSYDADGRL